MAFASTLTDREIMGSKWASWGTFVNTAGGTGGDVDTGLKDVVAFQLTYSGAAVVSSAPVYNETLPVADGVVTIVTASNTSGNWVAVGRL